MTAVLPRASTTQLPDVQEKGHKTQMQHCYTSGHASLLLSAPSTGCGRAARFMLHMLISASLWRRDDRYYWWSAHYGATLACPLQSANAFSLWVLSWQVWMQLQLEHRLLKNLTGARLWKWVPVPDNRILLNNLSMTNTVQAIVLTAHSAQCYQDTVLGRVTLAKAQTLT